MNEIMINGPELFLGGVAAFAVLWMVLRVRAGIRRAQAAAQVAQVGTRAVSLIGRTLVSAGLIVGGQWLVITYAVANVPLVLAVLTVPALLSSATLVRLLTVTEVRSARGGGRR